MMSIVTQRQTVVYDIDWAALSAGVAKLVLEKMNVDLENWVEINMKQMVVQDAADGLEVAELLEKSNWKGASNKIQHMDTAAREYVQEFIDDVAGPDFWKAVDD